MKKLRFIILIYLLAVIVWLTICTIVLLSDPIHAGGQYPVLLTISMCLLLLSSISIIAMGISMDQYQDQLYYKP